PEISDSSIFDENSFYKSFTKDLSKCRSEVIIESPFMTSRRVSQLLPTLVKLKKKRVKIIVNTRNPEEHDKFMCAEARKSLALLLDSGIQVIFCESLHRKTAILDRNILWEGSLNVLSQNDSLEVMRRTESNKLAWQMVRFIGLDGLIS
ncbi:MAG: phospholipase D-like domain-containing protein, partial [Candidatus Saccharimonadales bacterium]